MWRNYFGETNFDCRIIGVDINPEAKMYEKNGFEIFIGDQADPNFWAEFYAEIGNIDVLVDDGGHSNRTQIQTLLSSYPHIKDGGIIIIEDTHQSLSWTAGNPHPFSFLKFANLITRSITQKSPGTKQLKKNYLELLANHLYSVQFFQSIIVFYIDKNRSISSKLVSNTAGNVISQDLHNQKSFLLRVLNRAKYNKFIRIKIYLIEYFKNFGNWKYFQ
jgi:hypothetical protein